MKANEPGYPWGNVVPGKVNLKWKGPEAGVPQQLFAGWGEAEAREIMDWVENGSINTLKRLLLSFGRRMGGTGSFEQKSAMICLNTRQNYIF